MAIFSNPNAKELEKQKIEQDQREAELNWRQIDLDNREKLHIAACEEQRNNRDTDACARQGQLRELASREEALFTREQELSQREITAAAGFVEKQREAFRQAIDARVFELDQRQQELNTLEKRLAGDLETVSKKEGEVARREMAVLERELKADAGFSDKLLVLQEEIEVRKRAVQGQEQILRDRETAILAENERVQNRIEELRKREEQLAKSEQERDSGYAELKRQLDHELHLRRTAAQEESARVRAESLSAIEREMAECRQVRLAEINVAENAERNRTKAMIEAERTQQSEESQRGHDGLQSARVELEKRHGELDALMQDISYRERMATSKEETVNRRVEAIEEEVSRLAAERQRSFESSERVLRQENCRLRESLAKTEALMNCFDELKRRLGDEPEKVLLELDAKTEELTRRREEIANSPPKELRERFDQQQTELEGLWARLHDMETTAIEHRQRLAGENDLRAKLGEAEINIKTLRNREQILVGECSHLSEQLKRMRAAYEREEDREARIRDIEVPYLQVVPASRSQVGIDEVEWLESIGRQCIDYGLRFHPRILRAFHTSLKTAEWSPLTILAGVSGTGKSELPRLYSHFGGIPFLPLSVQPNWDSQESMLGFFNSIDNKFDAQTVLRFLAQSQRKHDDGYPGLEDAVCMVLLDEMNLAHPELYFAEFLSKLELRRGTKGSDVPFLDVKLGAGLKPYPLPLGRNVLWAGTMNQDETTKSLSDKVLDRSVVIYFPRPTTLERRSKLRSLPQAANLLPRRSWQGWWVRESDFSDEEIRPFKSFIEEMNISLSKVGRALGHRVWQSIEYYMANYPDVRAARKASDSENAQRAMRIAFEDQLVQKVMPKLRGIETRGRSKTECLDRVRAQVVEGGYQIVDDFDLACDFGYGQFMWQSANYLRDAEPTPVKIVDTEPTPVKIVDTEPTPVKIVNTEPTAVKIIDTQPPAIEIVDAQPPAFKIDDKAANFLDSPVGSKPAESETAITPDSLHPPEYFMPGDSERLTAWEHLGERQKKVWLTSKRSVKQSNT